VLTGPNITVKGGPQPTGMCLGVINQITNGICASKDGQDRPHLTKTLVCMHTTSFETDSCLIDRLTD
jgi:hypothetical protein